MAQRIDNKEKWFYSPKEAADLFESAQLIEDFVDAGWLVPVVKRKRLTRYDVVDLVQCRAKLHSMGDETLRKLAAQHRSKRK